MWVNNIFTFLFTVLATDPDNETVNELLKCLEKYIIG